MKRLQYALIWLALLGFAQGADPVSILCLGDSITYGASNPHPVPGGYRSVLKTLLDQAGRPTQFVGSQTTNSPPETVLRHEGWPGHRISQIGDDVMPTLSSEHPDLVLLVAGTNDIRQNFQVATAPQRLESLIDLIARSQPRAWILVGSLPLLHFDPKHPWQVTARAEFNAALPALVARIASTGIRARWVDLDTTLADRDICIDTTHPTASGYAKLGRAWFLAIGALEQPKPQLTSSRTP